jgi:type II secretory pathway pseudopilin PulG
MSIARLSRPVSAYRALPKKQKGFALSAVMVLFIMLGGITYMGAATAGRTIQTAVSARDFTESGLLADFAVQDAVYLLNEKAAVNPGYVLPTKASPRTGTSTTGSWQWYVERPADAIAAPGDPLSDVVADDAPGGGRRTVIRASGTFRGDTRNVTAAAGSTDVGGFKVLADKTISYEQGPAAAWSNAVQGRSVKVQNGAGLGAGTTFITGNVALTGAGPLDLTTYPGMNSKVSPATKLALYGAQAAKLTTPGAMKIPAGILPDSRFVTDNIARCGGGAPEDWVASRVGGILVANNNTACYNSMTFDVPVTVTGTGAFNAFVKNAVNFEDTVTPSSSTTALNIYTNGAVNFKTTLVGGTSMTLGNTFIFAPQGACTTVPFRDVTKGLTLTGSLACDTVSVAGKFDWKAPVNPLGSELYDREIWFLTDYHQPAGRRN